MPFIDDEPPPTTPETSRFSLLPRSVQSNPLPATTGSTYTAYRAIAHEGPEFSCRWNEDMTMTNIRPVNDRPPLPARIVVERTADRLTGIWCWLDGSPPRSAVDCIKINQALENIPPDIQVLNHESGQLDSITVLTGRRRLVNPSLLSGGQTDLFQCYYALKTNEPLTECDFPSDWPIMLARRSTASSEQE